MIPFFRKIRYRLAQDNQFLKYSRYALGEIILVVIGILVALAKTKKFQQILFEVNVKWNDFYTRLETAIEENKNLRKLIKSELKNY